jgi:hypothetical protein
MDTQPGVETGRLAAAVELCRRVLADRVRFDHEERAYKLELAARIRAALDAATAGRDFLPALRRAFRAPNNLTHFLVHGPFLQWAAASPEDGRRALAPLTDAALPPAERLTRFTEHLPRFRRSGPGNLVSLGSYFLMGVDPARFPMVRVSRFEAVERAVGWRVPPARALPGDLYAHHLSFAVWLLDQLRSRDVGAQDMLDVQGLIWILATSADGAIRAWRDGAAGGARPIPGPAPSVADGPDGLADRIAERLAPLDVPPPGVADLADELLLDEGWLQEVLDLLREKGQLVLYGPPGTGKTYVARRLAEHLAPDPARREVVQFHPSYAYEDFVQGYRPIARPDGSLAYELKPGPLVRLAQRAARSAAEHVLLIDEINRGNLPRILGELMYLLEYRESDIALLYGDGSTLFRLPANLLLLATMNTADRSIGLVDAALRRRFHFVPLFPDRPPLQGLLREWLLRHCPAMEHVADLFDRLNGRLRERLGAHLQLGPSYFMRRDLSETVLQRIWRADVMPFLEDQLVGREAELEQFSLEALREAPRAND